MEEFKISLINLAHLCHLASLGNLLGGLIHNLNSPLHSLGMQMDIMQRFLLKENQSENQLVENVSNRLSKMNDEFENLSNQLRIAGIRADFLDYPPEKMDINHFLHQEFEFLRANLYFKHNVETKLELAPSLPALTPLPPYFCLGMGLFLERLVEELERRESKHLSVGTTVSNGNPIAHIVIRNMGISEDFCHTLNLACSASPFQADQGEEINLYVAVLLLKNSGVTFETELKDADLSIQLTFGEKNPNH
ncbi:MAG: hypothetical protein WAL98_14710 [Desulfatiglandaceae bacterium]|jgi:hypothetical protein